ncbi:hypothetical protein Kpol_1004p32 [Vanderwaltozyma polyspora DSM 70294]|uniref:Presequence protease, mitochondrial n=1 Tax=Vanderwaltozyma polyspora (strain ATCC 22028 / DSM 70294 / BCRC 21397 / CBS 2163 / NBRC 10782 / NRRL Y-8283 / UCD 57-17) TaxID=436907 RepID=A7TJ89_VANPO|nr:uncharacterized protein Kpol_1004p32 [Vanderwaltozyma polyspora DSM 70294]EDO17658.1 hypothetical protein Kpol_1004p32 [Vanderwaltozyma polyspora DSM 70294]
MLRFQRLASSYAQAQVLRKYPVGGILHGYEVRRVLPVPELMLTAVDLVHKQTGSEHLHIDSADKNNTFSISFKTNPPDCTGVPHILEHTTLCGSQKYPVRDPFFKMLNRSLSNFMNAMTAHDYTFFPFSTTNETDFKNLRDVYIDATLNPLLKIEDFFQEGWRLEHSDVTDPKSPIEFKGVVYNEMKGQISNANYYFWNKFQESIYPSLNNSGGDPSKITNLTYENLVDFHSKNYHPSNSRTYTYGNLPLEDTLQFLNKKFAGYGKRNRNKSVLKPISLDSITTIETTGQIDPMLPLDKQTKSSMTWLCGSPDNFYETFLLGIIGNLLLDGHSSTLYKKLIETGLGTDFSVNTGMETTTESNFFTVGLNGISDAAVLKDEVLKTLKLILDEPINNNRVEAIIQQLELSKKDQKSEFGLLLLYSIIPGWSNARDPFNNLLFEETIARFREDWDKKGNELFKDIIRKYIIDKPYFQFTMKGSENFSAELEKEEAERLKAKVTRLDEDDKKIIFKRGAHLQALQNEKEDISCLPSLKVEEIPRTSDVYPVVSDSNIKHRITETNGITYLRGKINLDKKIPEHLFPLLPLFSDCLTHLGTKTEEYSKIEEAMKLYTGGISTHVDVGSDPITSHPNLLFRFDGWALNSKTDKVTEIWEKLLVNTDFKQNSEKIKVLIKSMVSSNTSSIAESGHSFARSYSSAHLSTTRAINEVFHGISQVQLLNKLAMTLENEELFQTEIVDKLVELQKYMMDSNEVQFFVTTDSIQQVAKVKQELDTFVGSLSPIEKNGGVNIESYPKLAQKPGVMSTLINFPFQVHYSGSSLPGVPYTHNDGAPLQVLSSMLTYKYLHKEIREKGGAYGGGATYSALDGIFSFYSYRDPDPIRSLETFHNCGQYVLENLKWDTADLNEAKLTLFQQVDAPISRKSEGTIYFHSGVTDEMRQKRREQLLDTSLIDIHRVAEKYLLNKKPINAVVGPEIEGKTVPPTWDVINF